MQHTSAVINKTSERPEVSLSLSLSLFLSPARLMSELTSSRRHVTRPARTRVPIESDLSLSLSLSLSVRS